MVVYKQQPADYWEVMIPGGAITPLKKVQQVFGDEWDKMRSRLIPGRKGWYDFEVDGVPLVSVEEKALPKMGAQAERLLSTKGGDENLFSLVVLAAGSVPSKM